MQTPPAHNDLAAVALQVSELSLRTSGQAQELTGCPLPSQTSSEGVGVSVMGKPKALMGTAVPARRNAVSIDCAERLRHGNRLPIRNNRTSGELMQPLQRSKSEPMQIRANYEMRQIALNQMCKAGGEVAPYSPSFARERMSSTDRCDPDSAICTAGMEGVQQDSQSQHDHAISNLPDVGSMSHHQHLREVAEWDCSMGSEGGLELMRLLQDLAVAVTAATQPGDPARSSARGAMGLAFASG